MNETLLAIKKFENDNDAYKGKIVSFINDTYGTKITALLNLVTDQDGSFLSAPLGGWPEDPADMQIALDQRRDQILRETLDALEDGKISVESGRKNPFKDVKSTVEPTVVETVGIELPLESNDEDVFGEPSLPITPPDPAPHDLGAELVKLISMISPSNVNRTEAPDVGEQIQRIEAKLDNIITFQRKVEEHFPFLKQ
jgi:hypothetical protein